MTLTGKGQSAVTRIRRRDIALRAKYPHDTTRFDRLGFEFRKLPASVLYFATGRATPDDYADLRRQGYIAKD